jgi:PAS domain-containing protein
MAHSSSGAEILRDWRLIALAGVISFAVSFGVFRYVAPLDEWLAAIAFTTIVAMLCGGLIVGRRMHVDTARMHVALNNMSQGLCMFDHNERLIVCNRRYLELYKLSNAVAKPGITLSGLLEYRITNGTFSRDPLEYRQSLLDAMKQGKTMQAEVKSADGRAVLVINRPMAYGG